MMIKIEDKNRITAEAILNDKSIQQLEAERFKLYSVSIPITIIKNGKIETIWSDETDNLLKKIEELIECRKNQIIKFYS